MKQAIQHTFASLLCGLSNNIVLEERFYSISHTQLKVALGTKGAIRCNGDTKSLCEPEEGLLSVVRVDLYLKDLRFDTCVAEDIADDGARTVTE